MHWGSGWGARFDAKGHGVADCSHPVKGFATLDCLLPICCAAVKASMDKHGQALLACNPLPTSYPALTLLTFWVTFCVTFHLTNTLFYLIVIQSLTHTRTHPIETFDNIKTMKEIVQVFCIFFGISSERNIRRSDYTAFWRKTYTQTCHGS